MIDSGSQSTPRKLGKLDRLKYSFRRSPRKTDTVESNQNDSTPGSAPDPTSSFMISPQTSNIQPVSPVTLEKAGLWPWPDDDKDEPGMIDIIAVHGLQGDWQKTWAQDGNIWLRDFLGEKIDNVQVLSFGYNSVINLQGWTHQLEDFSLQLLQAVRNYRSDSERRMARPIIFLGHSLGGLIIKKALITAHARSNLFSNILEHTKGLIFMGTPHRGSDAAKYAKILDYTLSFAGLGPTTDLFEDLKAKSRTLMQINADFPERASIMKILSFREMVETRALRSLVVDENSAVLGWANEEVIDLNADHMSMCKFAGDETQAFKAVWKPIQIMVKTIRNGTTDAFKQNRKKILNSLSINSFASLGSMSVTENASVEPAKGTCEWILSHHDYIQWQENSHVPNLLWITGGPGSGKSVLAVFVAKNLERNALVCEFSFSAGKFSLLDLFTRVIAQALEKNNELCYYAMEYWETTNWTKSWEDLCSFWTRLCEEAKGVQVFWVIDALDECSEPERIKDFLTRMATLLRNLKNNTTRQMYFHILLTSRPEMWHEGISPSTLESRDMSVVTRLFLEEQPAIEEDIKIYIHEEIEKLATTCTRENREKLEARLCAGADGSFLWPQLTLESIRTELNDEDSWDEIINAIPKTLEDTYERLLLQLACAKPSPSGTEHKPLPPKTKHILQCVVAAHGFLTEQELNMLFMLESQQPTTVASAESKAQCNAKFVRSVYGSFLRPVKGPDDVQVRLFHETARRHLLLPDSKSKYAMMLEDCHLALAKGCVSYLLLQDFDEVITDLATETSDKHPLLKYACLNWATHVREAERVLDDELFEDVRRMYRTNSQIFSNWSGGYWHFSSPGTGKITCTPLQMCAYNGHVRILRRLLEDLDEDCQTENDTGDIDGNTALHYATEYNRAAAVEVLLEAGSKPALRNKSGLAALHSGVMANRREALDALLRSGADVDIRTTGMRPGRTGLHLAAEEGLYAMVELLVQHGANTEILFSSPLMSSTAADIAFSRGYGDIYQLLLSKEVSSGNTDLDRAIIDGDLGKVEILVEGGVPLETTDNLGSTPLHRAARGTNEKIFKVLLGHISKTDIRDDDRMTPLHLASRYGRRETVEILISKGAEIDALSADHSTPLHEAALGGHKLIVDRLLDAKADQSIEDSSHRTPLFCAASLGFQEIVESFLTKAKTSRFELTPDDKGRLPIHIAAENGHKATVQALLSRCDEGTAVEDQRGRTPLSLAASGPSKYHSETVRFLIEEGADVYHKQRDGATPLLLAAKIGNEQSMRYLLDKVRSIPDNGASNVDEIDSSRSTPLSLAAAGGHEDAILLLLEYGAQDVSKSEKPGRRDPLSWVAGYGMMEVVKKLILIPGILIDSIDETGRTPLSWAAGNGHSAMVLQLLKPSLQAVSRANSDSADGERQTPLSGACQVEQEGMVRVNVNSVDVENRTPLSWAAQAGHKEVVKLLLSHGADQTIKSKSGAAPILWAAGAGHNELFSILFDEDPPQETMFNETGDTPLALAAFHGRTDTVAFLVDLPYPGANRTNKQGWTPLMHAASKGHEDVVCILLRHGADVHAKTPNSGHTALMFAAKEGSLAIVQTLIKHDPNVIRVCANEGETPLYLAVKYGHCEIVKLLLKSGCGIDDSRSRFGNTLAHVASAEGHILLLKLILEQSSSCLYQTNDDGQTPLMVAAANGVEQAVVVMLKYCEKQSLDPKKLLVRDKGNLSILSAAAIGGVSTILRSILDIESDEEIGSLDHRSMGPILYAIALNQSAVMRLLISRSPQSINQRVPQDRSTPLLWAASFGDEETVRLLLANPSLERYARDNRGRTSLWLAVTNAHIEIVQLLLQDELGTDESRRAWLNEIDLDKNISPLQSAVKGGYSNIVELLLKEKAVDVNQRSPDGCTTFLTGAMAGDEFLVRTLAANTVVDTNLRDYSGKTALMLACEHGRLRVVRYLLKEHRQPMMKVDDTDKKGMTALCYAAMFGADPAIVKLLLDKKASVDQRVPSLNRRNPLMLASRHGNVPVVRILSKASKQEGIDIDATDDMGFTALTIAAMDNNSNIVRFLLNEGANPNVRSRRSKRTPIMEAAYRGCAAAVRELSLCSLTDFSCVNDADRTATWFLMNGSPDTAVTRNWTQFRSTAEAFLEFEQCKLNINEVDVEGATPLLILAKQSNHLTVRRLLELQANFKYQSRATGSSAFHEAAKGSQTVLNELLEINISNDAIDLKDLDNATPLSYASGNPTGTGLSLQELQKYQLERYRMVRMLLDRKANPNSSTIKEKRTPLMFAAHLGWDKIIELLLEKKAKVDSQDANYSTALFLAVEQGHIASVQRLLEAKASYNGKDKTGATPAILAAKNGHLDLVRLFFSQYHAAINDKDRSGRTALSHAAEQGKLDVTHYFLEHYLTTEVDIIEIMDRQDQTPLMWACKNGRCSILQVLIDRGANFRCKDRNKRMPLSHAAENGHIGIVRQLLEEENAENVYKVLNWTDNAGRTALSWAAEGGWSRVVQILVHWGADASLGDNKKQTPRLFALDKGHTKLANILDTSEGEEPSTNILEV